MRVAYVSTDEVNICLAAEYGARGGVVVIQTRPHSAVSCADCDAAVYDLDFLPTEQARALLDRLLAGDIPVPAAVHSYNLDERQVKALDARGIVVARRLIPALFRRLRRLLKSSGASRCRV
jgi:hypothetical protein